MESDNETGLADDTNEFSERISGTLTFSEDEAASAEKLDPDSKRSANGLWNFVYLTRTG